MTIDIEPLRQSLGTRIEDEDVVTRAPLKAMIATFDRPEKAPEEGEPIAPGWHLCFLHSYARPAQLGRDGAAFTGGDPRSTTADPLPATSASVTSATNPRIGNPTRRGAIATVPPTDPP